MATLGKEWASTHPEAFEQYDREQYEWHCGLVKDIYAEALIELKEAEEAMKEPLTNSDFKRLASPELRRRVRDGAKMLRTIRQQVRAALDAMSDPPGEISKCLVDEGA